MRTADTLLEPARAIPVIDRPEVLITGGGVAGIAAAVAASRGGFRTTLVEASGSLGGTATAALMYVFYTPYARTHGLMRELCDRLIALDAAEAGELVPFDPEGFKYVAQEI